MIAGIGIDIVHVDRIAHWMAQDGLIDRFFHHDEIEAARSRKSGTALSLAARFAAKEALGKAGDKAEDLVRKGKDLIDRG